MSDKISRKKTFSYENTHVVSNNQTFVYTNLSVTIPAKSVYAVYGRIVWVNSTPMAVSLSSSPDSSYYEYQGVAVSGGSCSLAGFTESDLTLKLFGKWNSAGETTNNAYLSGWYEQL